MFWFFNTNGSEGIQCSVGTQDVKSSGVNNRIQIVSGAILCLDSLFCKLFDGIGYQGNVVSVVSFYVGGSGGEAFTSNLQFTNLNVTTTEFLINMDGVDHVRLS